MWSTRWRWRSMTIPPLWSIKACHWIRIVWNWRNCQNRWHDIHIYTPHTCQPLPYIIVLPPVNLSPPFLTSFSVTHNHQHHHQVTQRHQQLLSQITTIKDPRRRPTSNELTTVRELGQGNFSRIVEVVHKSTGESFAMKVIEKTQVSVFLLVAIVVKVGIIGR